MPMSRRKQPNPKPAKRESPDLADAREQVAPSSLPAAHLYLREFGGETLVLARHRLRKGTRLGAYKGKSSQGGGEEEESSGLLKISRSDGGPPLHVMLENEGHWLKLMRTANLPTDANICLRISGEDIVCTVTKDVNKEVELKVTYHIIDPESEQEFHHPSLSPENHLSDSIKEDSNSNSSVEGQSFSTKEHSSSRDMLDFASERSESFHEDMHSKSATHSDCESMEVERSRNDAGDIDSENGEAQEERCSSRLIMSPSRDEKASDNASSVDTHSSDVCRLRDNVKHLEAQKTAKPQQHTEGERIYNCQLCNFTAHEQHSLEKHLHSHRNPPAKRPSSKMTNAQSYCDACKIQFMNIDTYYVHKQLYCKGRHEKEDASTPPTLPESSGHPPVGFKPGPDTVIIRGGSNGGVPSSSFIQPQAIYAAISTNPLILLPCSLVNGQGLVPQAGVMPTGAPGIVLQTGIACPTIVEKTSSAASKLKEESLPSRKTSHPIMHFSSDTVDGPSTSSFRKRKMSEGDALNMKKSCSGVLVHPLDSQATQRESETTSSVDQDAPLDLSLKKFPNVVCRSPIKRKDSVISPGSHSPPNRTSSDSGSPHRSSVVHSRVTSSPNNSYSNDSVPCYPTQIPVVLPRQSSIDRVSPLPPVLHVDAPVEKQLPHPSMPPPKLIKQGNNVCEECNIVFYKYDNYMAHKRHYCAFRRQQLSALAAAASTNQDQSSDDNNSNHSGLNESSQSYQMDDGGKSSSNPTHFRSVIIKSSHSVYCCDACGVKFSTSDNLEAHQTYYCIKKADSAMSKVAAMRGDNSDSPHSLEPPFGGPEEWKCNYCDATCSSYETIRRHLMTHSELRGFRCIVCGYKGNTLRGMRTHACEHITEGSTSIEEFISTKVVAESGIVPIVPHAADHSDDDSDNSKGTIRRDHPGRTGTSSTKKNVLSDHSESNERSNSPRIVRKISRDLLPNSTSPVKRETSSSSPDANGNSINDRVNPMAFCDVVIKTENDQSSGEDSSREDQPKTFIKFEPEPEYDSDDKPQDLSKSPSGQSTSVIRRASDIEGYQRYLPAKRKGKSQSKHNSELKYCKVCDISFSHLSNFIAHKKFYCVSRVIQNCIQEAGIVQ